MPGGGGVGGLLPYKGYIGMCRCEGYGVFYISRVFSKFNVWSVLSQCNTRLRLLHLLYGIG